MTLDWAPLDRAASDWGIALSAEQRGLIERYLSDLLAYNRKVNLTADTDPQALLLRHIADGLAAVPVLKEVLKSPSPRIVDLGSGGGFIGIAIKIAWPEAQVTLMESLKRKYEFLNLAAARLGLKGLRVSKKSAGSDVLAGQETGFDAVVERALAPLPAALRLGLPLAAPGGYFLAFQSSPPDIKEQALRNAMSQMPATLFKIASYRLPIEEQDRHLALFRRE